MKTLEYLNYYNVWVLHNLTEKCLMSHIPIYILCSNATKNHSFFKWKIPTMKSGLFTTIWNKKNLVKTKWVTINESTNWFFGINGDTLLTWNKWRIRIVTLEEMESKNCYLGINGVSEWWKITDKTTTKDNISFWTSKIK